VSHVLTTPPDAAHGAHALDPVADSQRVSTAMHQFWIWAGANIAPINWVLGALGITLGLSLADTVLVLVVGNVIGMSVFGLFVLMGQRTGVSQMVLARSAFGRRGAYLPAIIQGIISAGWCAINTWIILDLVLALFQQIGIRGGVGLKIVIVLVVMATQVLIAASGFRAIAVFEKYTVPATILVLIAMTVIAWTRLGVDWGYAGDALTGSARISAMSTVMTAIGIGWGITWLAYASDYSRFVPRDMPKLKLYAASTLGQFIPVIWLGVLGATVATISRQADPGQLIVNAFGALAIPVLLLVIHGPIATNILNIYSCSDDRLEAVAEDRRLRRGGLRHGLHDRAGVPGQLRPRARRLAGRADHVGVAVGDGDGGPLLRVPASADRRGRALRPAREVAARRRPLGRARLLPLRSRRILVLRLRDPGAAAGAGRADARQHRPVVAGGLAGRGHAVRRARPGVGRPAPDAGAGRHEAGEGPVAHPLGAGDEA